MTDQSIFAQEQPSTPAQPQEPQAPASQPAQAPQPAAQSYDQYLSMIVNEAGEQKYKNVEEALKGAAHAQQHIATLNQQLTELQKGAEKSTTLESVMEALKSSNQGEQSTPPEQPNLDENKLHEMFNNFYSTAEQEKIARANEAQFSSELMSTFGDKAVDVLNTKAAEAGVDIKVVQEMARKSPVAAKRLLGITDASTPNTTPRSSVNTAALDNNQQQVPQRTFSMGHANDKDVMAEWNRVAPDKYNK